MRAIVRLVAVAALFVGLVPETASAQRWTWDLSLHGGYSMWTNMADQDESGVEEISFDSGPLAGAQLGWWASNRFGLRLNAAYESRETLVGAGDDSDKVTGLGESNIWAGSLDMMLRFRAPNETWMGSEFLPYLALGLGGRWVNPPGDDDSMICVDTDENKTWACAVLDNTGTNSIALGEQKGLMGLIGLGADWRLSPRFALRLEAFDRISKPQLYLAGAQTGTSPVNVALPNGDEQVSKWAHELGFQAGLNFLMGLREPAPVAVVTPPAPPPPPPPAPEPAPPREEAVTVCVIDPSATGGVRMQAATYRIEQRDTVVMVNGVARPLRESVGNIMVARNADWVVRGEPLNLSIGNETIRFLPYEGPRRIDGNQVVYLGNINGYPVYANRNEVADVVTTINTARGTRTDAELGVLLVDNRPARDVIQNVQYLYVPADPYGCTFQPIQPQQDVRKGGK